MAACSPRRRTWPIRSGDVLLLALAVGGCWSSPRVPVVLRHRQCRPGGQRRRRQFNLLQPKSRFGYIANGVAWPISLTLLAVARVDPATAGSRSSGTDRIAGFALPPSVSLIRIGILAAASFGHIGRPAIAPRHGDAPRGEAPVGAERAGGAGAEDRPFPVAHRQDLGPDHRDRGGPPDRLHHPVVRAGPRVRAEGA